MLVNLSYTGIQPINETLLEFVGVTLDRSYADILSAIENGANVKVAVALYPTAMGLPSDAPDYVQTPFAFTYTNTNGSKVINFNSTIPLGSVKAYVEIAISQTAVSAYVNMS